MLNCLSTMWIGILAAVATGSAIRAEASVGVLAKAARVLDLLAAAREMSTAELADTLEEPRSSVYRLLNALVELDLVEPGSQRGTFRLGLKLLRLGTAVISRLDVRLAALPVMERIHEETAETVFLCLRRGRDAVCIERIDGRRAAVMDLKLGGSLPIHEGSGPRSLLAFAPRAEWDAYIQGNPLYDSQTDSELAPATLVAELEEARRIGGVINRDVFPPGFATIGAPIYDHRGQAFAALSVSGVRDAILGENEERVFEMVTSGAREISRDLGYDRTIEQSPVRHRVAE